MKTTTWLALVRAIYRPMYRTAFRRTVRGRLIDPNDLRGKRFRNDEVDALFVEAWRDVDQLVTAEQLEQYRKRGGQSNVFFAALMIASYRALREFGLDPDYATHLCSEAGWKVYTKFAVVPKAIAKIRSRDPQGRLNFILRTYVRFPFTPAGPRGKGRPGYEYQTKWEPNAGYTTVTSCAPLNFVRQHIAEHGDNGELEFFQRTWCADDWPFVDVLAGQAAHYDRPHTLSFGDDRCDMVWSVRPRPAQRLPIVKPARCLPAARSHGETS